MKRTNTSIQTFLKAVLLLLLLFAGSRVINSFAFDNGPENEGVKSEGTLKIFGQEISAEDKGEGVLLSLLQPQRKDEAAQPLAVYNSLTELYPEHDICAEAWRVEVEVIPQWLQTPVYASQLRTEIAYNLLAGKLISNNIVDASQCENGGLLFNGSANACGLEIAKPAVIAWQNQFDEAILIAAKENRVPAFLLKRLFAKETQFWPGTSWLIYEYGLGQATSFGLDALFQYYPSYFQSICPAIFTYETCQKSYAQLSASNRALLRGYMASRVLNADCPTCEAGIDIAKVTASIDVFAKLLVANCHQVNQIIVNNTEEPGGKSSSYDDLWRFTLANYNAGAGCVSDAIEEIVDEEQKLNWVNFANELIDLGYACAGAIDYAYEISN